MRVIGGTLKGRRLASPRWRGLRPTSDKLRETLFNVLAPRLPGATLLDGYAGTGAVGIEALSRGAAHVTFIERDPRAAALIAGNLEQCGITAGYSLTRGSLDTVLQTPAPRSFDVIFLDPPYAETVLMDILARAGQWLAPDGVLVLEHARRSPAPASAGAMIRAREIISGDSALTFYRANSEPQPGRAFREPSGPRPSTDAGAGFAGPGLRGIHDA
jgi:16S rRNA (guanine966-N2)-methyltransferase